MEGMVLGKRGRGRPIRQWIQDIKDTLGMKMHEAGELARDREAFRATSVTTTRSPGPVETMAIADLIFVVIISLTLSITVIFNILVLVVIAKIPKLLNPTNILICNLAVSDVLLSGVVIPQNVHDVSHASLDYFEGDFSCRLVNFSPLLCVMAFIYTMVAMSFERKQAIVVTQQRKATMTQAVVVIPGIWFLALTFCIPTIYEYAQYTEGTDNGTLITRCGNNGVSRTYSIINGTGILLLAYILPLTILVINYGSILLFFRSRGLFGDVLESNGLSTHALFKIRMNVVKMLALVAALFAMSWLPYFTLLIIEKATGTSNLVDASGPMNKLRISLSVLSTTFNFCLNIIYNRNFRTGFKAFIVCQKVSMKRNTVIAADSRHPPHDPSIVSVLVRSMAAVDAKHSSSDNSHLRETAFSKRHLHHRKPQ